MRTVRSLLLPAVLVAAAAFAAPALAEYPHSKSMGLVQHLSLTIAPSGTAMASEKVVRQNFAVEPGLPVQLTIVNTTHRAHTFTVPALGISVLVGPARAATPATRTVTFTTHAFGVLRWSCLLCPDAHHEATTMQMGGKIYSIIAV